MTRPTPPRFDPAELSWFKATASSDQGACVEIAQAPEDWVAVRDSKDITRPGFAVPAAAFTALITSLQASTA